MSGRKYNIYDVTDEKIIETKLSFPQVKERIAESWSENEAQFNLIMRSKSIAKLNQYGSGLGYIIEPMAIVKPRVYAFYHKDQYVCSGTVREIAEFTGKSVQSLKNVAAPSYKKRFADKPHYRWMEIIEEEELECLEG